MYLQQRALPDDGLFEVHVYTSRANMVRARELSIERHPVKRASVGEGSQTLNSLKNKEARSHYAVAIETRVHLYTSYRRPVRVKHEA